MRPTPTSWPTDWPAKPEPGFFLLAAGPQAQNRTSGLVGQNAPMLGHAVARKPAPMLAWRGIGLRLRRGPVALGNALGSSLAEAASSPGQTQPSALAGGGGASGGWGGMEPIDYSLASGGPVRFGTGSVDAQPTPEELQAAFRQSERDYRSSTEQSVAGSGYVARSGDSISRIVGNSDPQAIGNFMRANGLTSSNVVAGRNYFVPDDAGAYGDSAALGQAVLNGDNTRLAALAQQRAAQQQAYWDSLQVGAWSGRTNQVTAPVAAAAAATMEVPQYDAMGNYTGTTTVVSAAPSSMGYVEQMANVANALHVPQGFIKNSYDQAVAGMTNSNNSWGERIVYGGLATAMLPLAAGEELVRGTLNIPSAAAGAVPQASQAGTNLAIALDSTQPTDVRVAASLAATRDTAFAFTGLGAGAMVLKPGLELGPIPSSAEVAALAGADRAQVLANIADSQAARASSNFGQFVKAEGRLQADLGIWPPNSGGYAPTYGTVLDVGMKIDRYGYPGGKFVSPLGESFESRALPPSYQTTKPYFQYEVVQPIPDVTQAKALPWFGQRGMGTQYQLPNSVQWYLDNGYLR